VGFVLGVGNSGGVVVLFGLGLLKLFGLVVEFLVKGLHFSSKSLAKATTL
jgi:hypothetical protein